MESHARVVVIGGGVVGCSILYHLAKLGWRDCLLVERQELTSGSSWHAAGGLFTVTQPNAVAEIHKYTFNIYPELERESGQSCGFHYTGGLNLCRTREEAEYFKVMQSAVRRLGIECEFITLEEVKRRAPVVDTSALYAAQWEVEGGHVDPASATQAFAAAARKLGARIERHNPVIETNPRIDGGWDVVTRNGTIQCDAVVNAAGLWGREVAALAGITLPLIPVEHNYLVTESIPEIEALDFELPQFNDGEVNVYARQEGKGLLVGAYETPCIHWSEAGTPADFGHELLPDDLGRMEWHFQKAVELLPCLATAGVKRVINGPMIFSPDLGPLLGPHPGLRNYFCANGVMTGFNQGAGIGKVMAEWIVEGEPSFDISCWDVARFGPWATPAYTRARTAYFYEHRSDRIYPQHEFAAGRPLRTPPVHDRLKAANAVFGQSFGLEHPLWFAPDAAAARDVPGYRRPNWFGAVMDECRRVREAAGLFEYSAMAKFLVQGDGATAWLDRLLANRLPSRDGRVVLSPMLSPTGRLIGDFTVTRLGEERYLLLGSDVMQLAYMRHFRSHLPFRNVEVRNVSETLAGLHLAGPAAQEILAKVADGDVSTAGLSFLRATVMDIAGARAVTVLRLSFTGEAGYELYCEPADQPGLFDALRAAGGTSGLGLVGTRCLMMTRLEKSFPAWGSELSPDYSPVDAGLSGLVATDKGDFIGREAVVAAKAQGPREVLSTLVVDADDADCWGTESVFRDGELVGYVTSGGFGAHTERSIALAYLAPDAATPGQLLDVEILGELRSARVIDGPLYDPPGARMRA